MEILEFFLPRTESVEISVDNHLCGFIENWDEFDEYHRGKFKIPLPDGNWVILHTDNKVIRIQNFK